MKPFEYDPLANESVDIRLITLRPGNFEDHLKIRIFHIPLRRSVYNESPYPRMPLQQLRGMLAAGWRVEETLEDRYIFINNERRTFWKHPDPHVNQEAYELSAEVSSFRAGTQFEALSYTWGADGEREIVQVEPGNNHQTLSTVEVKQDLASALRHLRLPHETRTLWVDAICINQDDRFERQTQVKRMADIYKLAYRVVVWLGPCSWNSKLAFSTLDHFAEQVDFCHSFTRVSRPEAIHAEWSLSADKLPYDNRTWQSILDLINRSWFDRLWIIQEIQLGSCKSIFQCGLDSIEWPRFRRAGLVLRFLPQLPSTKLLSRLVMVGRLVKNVRRTDFLGRLVKGHQRLCSDPRDKIYGHLGLASPKLLNDIKVEYSLPVVSVYRDLFIVLGKQSKRLEALKCCIKTDVGQSGLQSWVPDWTKFPRSPMGHQICYSMVTVTAGYSQAHASFLSKDILQVSGIEFATVHDTKGPAPMNNQECLEAVLDWAPSTTVYPTGEAVDDAYALTLVRNRTAERFHYLMYLQTLPDLKDSIRTYIEEKVAYRLNEVIDAISQRVFINTTDGSFGLGPDGTEPGMTERTSSKI